MLKRLTKHIKTIEKLPNARIVHLGVGVTVISFFTGMVLGGIGKAVHVSYLHKIAAQRDQEQEARLESLLRRVEMDIDFTKREN